jgi:hypothetical protein
MVHILRLNEMANTTYGSVREYFNRLLMEVVERGAKEYSYATYDGVDYAPIEIGEDFCGMSSQSPVSRINSNKITNAFEKECRNKGLDNNNADFDFMCKNEITIDLTNDKAPVRKGGYNFGKYKINEIPSVTIRTQSTLMDIDGCGEYETDDFFKEEVVFDQPIIVANGSPYLSKRDEAKLVAVMKRAADALFEHYN